MSEDYYCREGDVGLLRADALYPSDPGPHKEGKLAITAEALKVRYRQGLGVQIAQLYQLVLPGLILTRHVFKGLRRPLYCDGSDAGDKEKLIYTRRPAFDSVLAKDPGTGLQEAVRRAAPPNEVFVVIVSPNIRHKNKFPRVDGWIEHWNWTKEDLGLPEAPVNWIDRYDEKIFTVPW